MSSNPVLSILPTLLGCFLLILIGYITGRFRTITTEQGKGIRIFTANFLLPALIFKAIVQVNFSIVNWQLWTALLISKSIFFVIVVMATLYFAKDNRFGKAGLYAICVTQSNDFAFGIPLFQAIFPPSQQFLTDYMYLIAPVSLALLNPIGFVFLEYQQARNKVKSSFPVSQRTLFVKLLITTLKGIVTNPLIFTIVFAIFANFIFKQQIPKLFTNFFDSLSNAFSATALFYLGWSLGIQLKTTMGRQLFLPIMLAVVKGIFMSVVMRFIASNMINVASFTGNGLKVGFQPNYTGHTIETFSFLYGALPSAPTVMIYASKYQLAEDIIGSTLVISTLFSGPIIFASVRMIEVINVKDVNVFLKIITEVSTDISIFQVVCSVWVSFVFFCLQLFRRPLYRYTHILIFFQLLLGISVIVLRNIHNHSIQFSHFVVWMVLTSLYSCCGSAAIVTLNLLRTCQRKETHWIIAIVIYFLLFTMTTILVVTSPSIVDQIKESPFFLLSVCFKDNAGILFIFVGLITLIAVAFGLVQLNQHFLQDPDSNQYQPLRENRTEVFMSSRSSIQSVMSYLAVSQSIDTKYVTNHVILMLGISFMIVINICICLWNIIRPTQAQGIFLGVEMLGVVLTYGQGFFSLVVFGFLKDFFMLSEFLRRHWFGAKAPKEISPRLANIDLLICHKFVKDHLAQCEAEVLEARHRGFTGKSLAEWLLDVHLVTTREDACEYANVLLQGQIIIPVDGTGIGLFRGDDVMYQFGHPSLQTDSFENS